MKSMSGVAEFEVEINGNELPPNIHSALLKMEVQDDLEGPLACWFSFHARDESNSGALLVDDERFEIGNAITVKVGYQGDALTEYKAEIVAIELELSSEQTPRFSVRAYDRSHRLRRGTHQRSFTNMKDSDIAAQIAAQNGLSSRIEDSGAVIDYVLQDNQTDLDFLRERAGKIDYEVVVDDKDLVFRTKRSPQTVVLVADQDVTELTAYVKAMDHVGTVEVRGWDPETKTGIVGTSRSAKSGPAGVNGDAAFGKATLVIVDQSMTNAGEADRAARAEFEKRARRSMGVDGSCIGRADLRAGVVIDVREASARFDGTYRLTSVTHKFSVAAGFHTSFSGEKVLT